MDELEVVVKSCLPPDDPQGVYRVRIGRKDTVEKLLRNVCLESNTIFRDDLCLRSKEHQLLNRSDTIAEVGLVDGAFLHWTSEESIKQPGCAFNVFWFLALISFIIGIIGIVSICVIKFRKSHTIIDYAIVFDAGSSHTAMFIYKWDGSKMNGTAVAVQAGDKCRAAGKGISSYIDHPQDAGKSLVECLGKAKDFIPKAKHSSTPVYLGATAGMRLVNISHPKQSDEIMKSVRATFSNSSFSFPDPNRMARIISGFEEGSFSWISSNYITNSFDVLKYRPGNNGKPAPTIVPTLGALDLGGASTQISFIPDNTKGMPASYTNVLELFGHNYTLYTHSYLCYGADQVRIRILAHLVNMAPVNSSSIELSHPCLPVDFNMTMSHKEIFNSPCVNGDTAKETFGSSINPLSGRLDPIQDDRNFTFIGLSIPGECQQLLTEVLINDSIPCPYSHCSFNGIYQPPVTGVFYAFSSYYYTVSFLNLTTPQRSYFNHSDFEYAIDRICAMPWAILKTLPAPQSYLPWYCENAVLINILLSQGYHFKDEDWLTIYFVEKVSSTEIGWTLGFVLSESNSYESESPEEALYTVTYILLMILFSLFLLIAFCLACHAKRSRQNSFFRKRTMSSYGAI